MERQSKSESPDRELLRMTSGVIKSSTERGVEHTSVSYKVNPAKAGNHDCTSCDGQDNKPVVVHHERDHWGQEFIEAWCETCTPDSVLNDMRTGNG